MVAELKAAKEKAEHEAQAAQGLAQEEALARVRAMEARMVQQQEEAHAEAARRAAEERARREAEEQAWQHAAADREQALRVEIEVSRRRQADEEVAAAKAEADRMVAELKPAKEKSEGVTLIFDPPRSKAAKCARQRHITQVRTAKDNVRLLRKRDALAAQGLAQEEALARVRAMEARMVHQQEDEAHVERAAEERARLKAEERARRETAVEQQSHEEALRCEAKTEKRRQAEQDLFLAAVKIEAERMMANLRAAKDRAQREQARRRFQEEQAAQAVRKQQALLQVPQPEAQMKPLRQKAALAESRNGVVAEEQTRDKGRDRSERWQLVLELESEATTHVEQATAAADAIVEDYDGWSTMISAMSIDPQEFERHNLVQHLLNAQTALGNLNHECENLLPGIVANPQLDSMWLLFDATGDALSVAFSVGSSQTTFEHFQQVALHALELLSNAEAMAVAMREQVHHLSFEGGLLPSPPLPLLQALETRDHQKVQKVQTHQKRRLGANTQPVVPRNADPSSPRYSKHIIDFRSNATLAQATQNSPQTVSSMRSVVPRFAELKNPRGSKGFGQASQVPCVSVDLSAGESQEDDNAIRNQAECGFGESRRGMSVKVRLKPVTHKWQ
jgi:hypothetical protein